MLGDKTDKEITVGCPDLNCYVSSKNRFICHKGVWFPVGVAVLLLKIHFDVLAGKWLLRHSWPKVIALRP